MENRLSKKIRRLFFDKRAVSNVISSVLMTATVMSLGIVVLAWAYQRSSFFNSEYADLMEANSASIKEKIVFEYIFYNTTSNELTVYLMNCGRSNDLSLVSAYLSDGSWSQSFYDVELKFLNGTLTQNLDIGDEGYFKLSVSLVAFYTSYFIRIMTGRERIFVSTFVA